MKKKIILTSVLSIALLASLATGATYALFTSEAKANIAITSGKVDVLATINGLTLSSKVGENEVEGAWANGGTAELDGNKIVLENMTPGDTVKFNITVTNNSTVKVKARNIFNASGELVNGLTITGFGSVQTYGFTNWETLEVGSQPATYPVVITLDENVGNEYQGKSAVIDFAVEAVQGNAPVLNPIDKEETNVYTINAKEGLLLVDDLLAERANQEHLDFYLAADIDLAGCEWNPVALENANFYGQDHVISNLTVEGTNYVGLFAEMYNANIEDVVLKNANVSGNHYVGGIVGYQSKGSVSGCSVIDSTITAVPNVSGDTYDNGDKVGGIVGYSYTGSDSVLEVTQCTVDNVELYGYRDIGGIAGCANADNITENNVSNVDLYVDQVTNWYADKDANADYVIGRVINGSLAASNVVSGENNITVKKAVASDAALDTTISSALSSGENADIVLSEGEYTLPSSSGEGSITITGTEDTVVDVTLGAYMDNANVSFEGVTIKGSIGYANGNGSDYAALYSPDVQYKNCHFEGAFRIGRDGASFVNCTFDLTSASGNAGYVWCQGNDVTFENCTFNTDGKAILVYSDGIYGTDGISTVKVTGCTFNATAKGYAYAVANQECAAIEIDNYGAGANVITSNNTYDSNFSGEWRIKSYYADRETVTVNGVIYTQLALDGKLMTIDSSRNVTFVD